MGGYSIECRPPESVFRLLRRLVLDDVHPVLDDLRRDGVDLVEHLADLGDQVLVGRVVVGLRIVSHDYLSVDDTYSFI